MKLNVKAFGVTKDILGQRENVIEIDHKTVGGLRNYLLSTYPGLDELKSLFIAVNNNYADDLFELTEADEVALIPPVSGG